MHRVKNGVVQIRHGTTAGNHRSFPGTWVGDRWVSTAITEPCGRDSCDGSRSFFMCEREELYSAARDSTWAQLRPADGCSRVWPSRVNVQRPAPREWPATRRRAAFPISPPPLGSSAEPIKQEYDSLIRTTILSFIPVVQEYILMSKTSDLFRWFGAGVSVNVLAVSEAHRPRGGTAVLYINSFANSQRRCARVGS